jgi:pimeloyl-ACP methyl ester carboxylesterase
MGGRAAAHAVAKGPTGEIDRLVLLAPPPIEEPERITGPKLFAVSEGDPLAPTVRAQFGRAPDPKQLLVLGGSAHAQFMFETDEGELLMAEILQFLKAGTVSTP